MVCSSLKELCLGRNKGTGNDVSAFPALEKGFFLREPCLQRSPNPLDKDCQASKGQQRNPMKEQNQRRKPHLGGKCREISEPRTPHEWPHPNFQVLKNRSYKTLFNYSNCPESLFSGCQNPLPSPHQSRVKSRKRRWTNCLILQE